MNLGFWSLTISNEITTDINIQRATRLHKENISFTVSDTFQTGAGSNFISVTKQALDRYKQELQKRIQ